MAKEEEEEDFHVEANNKLQFCLMPVTTNMSYLALRYLALRERAARKEPEATEVVAEPEPERKQAGLKNRAVAGLKIGSSTSCPVALQRFFLYYSEEYC